MIPNRQIEDLHQLLEWIDVFIILISWIEKKYCIATNRLGMMIYSWDIFNGNHDAMLNWKYSKLLAISY